MLRYSQIFIRLVTAIIPFRSVRRQIRQRLMGCCREVWLSRTVPRVRKRYAELERACRARLAAGNRLRVCFIVCDVSMFSAEPVYQAMCQDSRFEPFIAIVPRVSRGESFLRATLAKTVSVLSARYSGVRSLYDPDTRVAQSLEGQADVVFTSVIYNDQTLERYTALPLSRFALLACIPYVYSGLFKVNVKRTVFLPQIALMWRIFLPTQQTVDLWTECNPLLRGAAVLNGYVKMDRLAGINVRSSRPKTVILAPHHSLPSGTDSPLTLSTFLTHADFFLKLPGLYPEIHFIFRPHPLLFTRLATSDWWGPERVESYCKAMEAFPNVEFQRGGDYFDAFVNSDALIHDCGSFLAEYFYTGHPQCYLLADDATIDREFLPFGKKLLEHVNRAYSSDEIRSFIETVVLAGNDPGRQERDALARKEVCVYHPYAAKRTIDDVFAGILGGSSY